MANATADPMPNTPAAEHVSVRCEFCECKLTRKGQVIDISDKAKSLRRLQDGLDKSSQTIETQAAEIARLTSELAEAKAAARRESDTDPDDPEDDYFGN